MSDTRRARQQLRQSLVQHVFHYYEEMKMTLPEEEAKRLVRETVSSILEPFMGDALQGASLSSFLTEWEKEWLDKELQAQKEKDYDTQYLAADVLDALRLLKSITQEKEDAENGH